MKFNSIGYFFLDAFKSLKRNKTITFASVVTVFVTFIVLGTFMLVAFNFSKGIEDVASQVQMKIYLNNDILVVDQKEIEAKLVEQSGVKNVTFESKDEAFKNFKESMADSEGILSGYDLNSNPLPSSLIVELEDAKFAEDVAKSVEKMPGVESIGNQQDLINTITSFVKGFKIIGIVLLVIFIGVSIFLIMNTIKLAVYSRRREIGIMKFVGATDWFIRWPFVIEGVIIGAIGSIISTVVLYASYRWLHGLITSKMVLVTLVAPSTIASTFTWIFIAGGILIGAIGSGAAIRKFLIV